MDKQTFIYDGTNIDELRQFVTENGGMLDETINHYCIKKLYDDDPDNIYFKTISIRKGIPATIDTELNAKYIM